MHLLGINVRIADAHQMLSRHVDKQVTPSISGVLIQRGALQTTATYITIVIVDLIIVVTAEEGCGEHIPFGLRAVRERPQHLILETTHGTQRRTANHIITAKQIHSEFRIFAIEINCKSTRFM